LPATNRWPHTNPLELGSRVLFLAEYVPNQDSSRKDLSEAGGEDRITDSKVSLHRDRIDQELTRPRRVPPENPLLTATTVDDADRDASMPQRFDPGTRAGDAARPTQQTARSDHGAPVPCGTEELGPEHLPRPIEGAPDYLSRRQLHRCARFHPEHPAKGVVLAGDIEETGGFESVLGQLALKLAILEMGEEAASFPSDHSPDRQKDRPLQCARDRASDSRRRGQEENGDDRTADPDEEASVGGSLQRVRGHSPPHVLRISTFS
jgi:hypothetical protein